MSTNPMNARLRAPLLVGALVALSACTERLAGAATPPASSPPVVSPAPSPITPSPITSSPPAPTLEVKTYTPTLENFPNPERGWFHSENPVYVPDAERAVTWLATDQLRALRAEGVTLVRKYYLLQAFRSAPISAAYLQNLERDFALVREAGVKLIPRFSYISYTDPGTWPTNGLDPNFTYTPDASLEVVETHLDQLKSIFNDNADVIAFLEAGLVGYWGEWHDSSNRHVDNWTLELQISVTLRNVGFASPYNPRGLELILRNKSTGKLERLNLLRPHQKAFDPRLWLPDDGEITFEITQALPSTLEPGAYELLLNLPDPAPALSARPEYSLGLANADVWEPATGYNKLLLNLEVRP